MINSDLMRSYNQYKNQQKIGHLQINFLHKLMLSILFFTLIPLSILKLFRFKIKKSNTLFILPFRDSEPFISILDELRTIKESVIITYPNALLIFPDILIKDFYKTFKAQPLWTIKNLDFFGALSLKVSQYYGYKIKYGMSRILLFQEYSFYSSYLTRVFEYEEGSVYNLMHGFPGKEASFFRFTKCFVWGKYFEDLYIVNKAEADQFIVAGSIYHEKLLQQKLEHSKYDILYVMQGKKYSNDEYVNNIFKVLKKIQMKSKLKIAIKPHPRYSNDTHIPKYFDTVQVSPVQAISESKLIISHFSTMLLDAQIMGKHVLAFLPKNKIDLVSYMKDKNIFHNQDKLYMYLLNFEFDRKPCTYNSKYTIDFSKNTIKIIASIIERSK